jgi:uncharacterized protein (TIGR03435 family)
MDRENAQRGAARCLLVVGCVLFFACVAGGQTTRAPMAAQAPPAQAAPAAGQASAMQGTPATTPPANPAPAPQSNAAVQLPGWDAASIKPSDPNARESRFMFTPDGISVTHVPLFFIVREAFGLEDDRIFGGPAWAKTSFFDIQAKVAPEDAAKLKDLSFPQRFQMVIALLQDRCGFKFHHEKRDLPVYDLVVAKGGSKLTPSKPDVADENGEKHGNHMLLNRRGHIESTGADFQGLARMLSAQLHRTVIDKTGLTGSFDYKLDWSPDDAPPAMAKAGDAAPVETASSENSGPSLFTALEEQLGLKLESSRGPVDVVVIDQLEQPTAN